MINLDHLVQLVIQDCTNMDTSLKTIVTEVATAKNAFIHSSKRNLSDEPYTNRLTNTHTRRLL